MKATVSLSRNLEGRILDIGGGGEGVIGRVYGEQVVAIDNRQSELDEAPDGFEKVLMDAAQLSFANETFDAVTAFFSLMYFSQDTLEQAVAEAYRVLRPGGLLCIWDAAIEKADPFIIELDIVADGIPIHTTYGIYDPDKAQTAAMIRNVCTLSGFMSIQEVNGATFYHCYRKL